MYKIFYSQKKCNFLFNFPKKNPVYKQFSELTSVLLTIASRTRMFLGTWKVFSKIFE